MTDQPRPRILVVDDEQQILRALRVILREAGFEALPASTGEEALDVAAIQPPDAGIVDLLLPDMDGVELCRRLREWTQMPLIVLSAVGDEEAKVRALAAGADDYVTKPFAMGELLARLRAALRRDEVSGGGAGAVATIGRWAIDLSAHTIRPSEDVRTDPADSPASRLTPTEWRILGILLRRPEQLVSSAQLLAGVWGPGFENRTNYLRFHMARLRRKLEDDPSRPQHLLTEPGMGYRYQP